jgi:ABC-type glycerol-3-phosphate transport system substrate-binding protein
MKQQLSIHYELDGVAAQVFERQLEDFSRETGVVVGSRDIPLSVLDGPLEASVRDGSHPDAVLVPSDHVAAAAGLRLSEVPRTLLSSESDPRSLALAALDGTLFGVPLILGNHLVMYRRRELLARSRCSLESLASLPMKEGVSVLGLACREPYWLLSFLLWAGGELVDGAEATLETPAMIRALRALRQLVRRGITPADLTGARLLDALGQGRLAATIDGEWRYVDVARRVADRFEVAPLPTLEGRPLRAVYTALVLIFPGRSLEGRRGKLLERLARHLQGHEAQQLWAAEGRRIPVHLGVRAEREAAMDDNERVLTSQLDSAQPLLASRGLSRAWRSIRGPLGAFVDGDMEEEDAARAMQQSASRSSDAP